MKKAILFDFGGTLDTNGVHWYVKFKEFFNFEGVNIPDKIFREAYLYNENQIRLYAKDIDTYDELLIKQIQLHIEYLKSSGFSFDEKQIENQLKKFLQNINQCLSESIKLIRQLKDNYKIAVISNFYGNLEKICKSFGLNGLVDVYTDSTNEECEKPDTRIYSVTLKRLGIKGEDVYMVGDSYDRDIVPAKELGCTTIWLKNKSWKEEINSEKSDFTINNLNQIINIIKNEQLRK